MQFNSIYIDMVYDRNLTRIDHGFAVETKLFDELDFASESAHVLNVRVDRIEEVIIATLKNLGITSAKVSAVDKGALDCTIEARTVTAIHRAAEKDDYNWKEMDTWNV